MLRRALSTIIADRSPMPLASLGVSWTSRTLGSALADDRKEMEDAPVAASPEKALARRAWSAIRAEVQGRVQEARVHGLLEQRVQCLLIVTTGKEDDEVGGWVDKACRR